MGGIVGFLKRIDELVMICPATSPLTLMRIGLHLPWTDGRVTWHMQRKPRSLARVYPLCGPCMAIGLCSWPNCSSSCHGPLLVGKALITLSQSSYERLILDSTCFHTNTYRAHIHTNHPHTPTPTHIFKANTKTHEKRFSHTHI